MGQKKEEFRKSKQAFHSELYEFARKLMRDISEDMENGEKIDPGRMYAFTRMLPLIGKVKEYEDEAKANEKQEERKALKNKGYYRGARGGYQGVSPHYIFANDAGTYRIVLCTVHIDPNKDHFLRCRNVSDNGSTEFMLDYLEIVPKSVYGVEDEEQQEDDL